MSLPPRLGVHVLADVTDVADPSAFEPEFLVAAFRDALHEAGTTVRRTLVEEFTPHGLSVMVVLAESHASLHTWPERRTMLIDAFTCGPVSPLPVVEKFAAKLGPCRVETTQVDRGVAG
ncbi:adenosylmethionine decarboxylase [Pseudonocardia zijingensis]|uniref:adenosylmethionine decarboxylase n=1 Tax=Pseudonocardia zijingensis TaxID=153376 RepID=UPI0031DEB45A